MTDLGLKTFDKLYPMLIHKYKDLIVDQNATEKDKINQIIVKLNALGKLSNDVVRDWNTVYQWTMNDGLSQDVNNKLEAMKANGEFDNLVATVVALIGDLSTLETTAKDTVVHAINEVDELAKANQTKMGDLTTLHTTAKDTTVNSINEVDDLAKSNQVVIGDKSTLHTTAKDTMVNAINEVDDLAKSNQTNIGDLTALTTVDKDTIVHAINDNVASLNQIAKHQTNWINVKQPPYNAKGDGTTDDTTAIQNAINDGYNIYLPAGTYIISASLDLRKSNIIFFGDGMQTVIQQNIDNIAILKVGGEKCYIHDIKLQYKSVQGNTLTGSNGIEIYKLYESVITRLYIVNSYNAIYLPQVDYSGTGNYLYSVEISNIRVVRYSNNAIDLRAYGQNNSGSILRNIYINNWDGTTHFTAQNGLFIQNWDDGILQQINIEHGNLNEALVINTCNALTVQSLHLEDLIPQNSYQGFIDILTSGSTVFFSGVTVQYCTINPDTFGLFRVDNGIKTEVRGISERNNTRGGSNTNWNLFYSGNMSTGSLRVTCNNLLGITSNANIPTPALLKEID